MALSVSSLAHAYESAGSNPISTPSLAPAANSLLVLAITSTNFTAPVGFSPRAELGLTWTPIAVDVDLYSTRYLHAWFAPVGASPQTGVRHIDNPVGAVGLWEIMQVSGTPSPATTLRQGRATADVVPPTGDAGLSTSLATSVLLGIIGVRDSSATITAISGFTILNNFNSPDIRMATDWRTGSTSGACGFNFDSPGQTKMIGLEIAEGSSNVNTVLDATVGGTLAIAGRSIEPVSGGRPPGVILIYTTAPML